MYEPMKRYNVHIPTAWIDQIALLQESLQKNTLPSYRMKQLTIADLIRTALAELFGFKKNLTYTYTEDLPQEIKKALKQLAKEKKWPKQ